MQHNTLPSQAEQMVTVTDDGYRIAFVRWNDVGQCLVLGAASHRADPLFTGMQWAVLEGGKPVVFNYPLALPQGQADVTPSAMWNWWPAGDAHSFGTPGAALHTSLVEIWEWDGQGEEPLICRDRAPAAQPDDPFAVTPQEKADAWRRVVAPVSAQIIGGLYCPDGVFEDSSTRGDSTHFYDWRWAGAAAREARAWLGFYRRVPPPDRRHQANAYHLARIQALALIGRVLAPGLDIATNKWSRRWPEDVIEAIDDWLAICLDSGADWFFDARWWHVLPAGSLHGLRAREWRREAEVDRVREGLRMLLEAGVPSSRQWQLLQEATRRQLETLQLRWYLPRYNVGAGWLIEQVLTSKEPWHRAFLRSVTLGATRLYAGVGFGLLAVALQDDTWNLAARLVVERTPLACGVTVLMALATYAYLAWGIAQRLIIQASERAWWLWVRGQGVALCGATFVTGVVAPLLIDEKLGVRVSALGWAGIAVLVAQLALFIGIFTQLLFGEKPATAPLDGP